MTLIEDKHTFSEIFGSHLSSFLAFDGSPINNSTLIWFNSLLVYSASKNPDTSVGR